MTTTFLYGAGALTRRYVHWPGADVPMASYADATLSNPTHLFADHQGSIVAHANGSGTVTAINRYDEYGIPAATPQGVITNVGRFQYTGQIWLPELGMYHYKSRVYSPYLGRFMQVDPVGYEGGFNLYAYVGNDPANATDPDGKNPLLLLAVCARIAPCRQTAIAGVRWGIRQLAPRLVPSIGPRPAPPVVPPTVQENADAGGENTNPYRGPVGRPVNVTDSDGNTIPVQEGEQIGASPDGDYQHVRDREGRQTGVSMHRGGHRRSPNPNARGPHGHRPGVTRPGGDPHLPLRPRRNPKDAD